jgi:D-alanyl-D-alanine carboxypeptidase (penicillin-binding protein 5/6)
MFDRRSILGAGASALAVGLIAQPTGVLAQANTQSTANSVDTSAETAFVIDHDTGTVLFEKRADELVAPASMSKIMTQELVFREISEGRLKLDDTFPISVDAWRRGGAPSGGSTMFAQLNSRISVRDLLRGAIIISANDACIALAEGIAGSEEAFSRRLTARARELGLTRSTFTNSTGLPDPGLRVTARELALLSAHVIRTYPEFYKWYSEREFQWNVRRPQQNRNPLLRDVNGADGIKTGFTSEAGYSLVGSVLRDERRVIVVVTGLKADRERAAESRKLVDWAFRNFESRLLFAGTAEVGEARIFGGEKGSVALVANREVRVLLPRGANPRDLRARIVYAGPHRAPIEAGRELAKLQILSGQTLALERPLFAATAVERGSLPQRALDGAFEFVRGFF